MTLSEHDVQQSLDQHLSLLRDAWCCRRPGRAGPFRRRILPAGAAHVQLPRPDLVLVAVVAQERLERLWQGQLTDAVELAAVADGGPGQLLEAEAAPPQHGVQQHRLEEHAAQRVLVVLEQTAHRSRAVGLREIVKNMRDYTRYFCPFKLSLNFPKLDSLSLIL